ncbi:uncharacterized protein LOC108108152 isoform X2 [Drosophila eugracilis]|nr:uncharacterized protein LOC108108152 isoform X2 [Drosophila eugracilis]
MEPLTKEPWHPKMLKSMDQMKRALKPLQLQPYSEILISNQKSEPSQDKPRPKIMQSHLSRFGLVESMARMRGDSEPRMEPPPRLPVLKDKTPVAQAETPFVRKPGPEKFFISDRMMTNELKLLQNKDLELYYMEEATLIDHLKKAAAGLPSASFPCSPTDKLELVMRPNTTLRTVLPEVLEDFAYPFLRAGSAFRRLSARSKLNRNSRTRLERPLNRAMREILVDFLATNRQFMLTLPADSPFQLLFYARHAMELVHQLEIIFKIEPRLNVDTGVSGAVLLSRIWWAINICGNVDVQDLLLYIMRFVTQRYFVQLQKWIYRGELDTAVNEIFINRCLNTSTSLVNECSKEFFDNGYQVVIEEVPKFLSGCEHEILQCGKYSQVLKAYNPQHPVFNVEYPDIVVCLTVEEVKEMRHRLANKYAGIYQRFGSCSMQSIFEERMATKRVFANLMVQRTQAYFDAWEEEQRVLQLKANAQKKLLYDKINAEQELHQQNRLEKRKQEIVNELAFIRERELLEDIHLKREKQELQKEVIQLAADLIEKDTHEVISPDQSTYSDLSYTSCLEGPDCRTESISDKDGEKLKDEAVGQSDKPPDVKLDQPGDVEQRDVKELPVSLSNWVQYQRSHSDVLNSNEQPAQTELIRNRQHALSSDQFQECQTRVNVKQTDTSTTSTSSGLRAQLPSDINANLNCPETEALSDMQRNRRRNEQHDGFSSFNTLDDEHTNRLHWQRNSNTERAKNRRRVLESEFGISLGDTEKKAMPCLPLELNMLHVEVPLSVLTPMSTTSDVDIGGLTPKEFTEIADMPEIADNDAANNNNVGEYRETLCPESKKAELVSDNPMKQSEDLRHALRLPSPFNMEEEDVGRELQNAVPNISDSIDPFMAQYWLQFSVMTPVNAYYALLRNEVIRIFQEMRICEHFRKLRNYFFLLDGQFGETLTSDILKKIKAGVDPPSLCQKGILDTILTNALSACSSDETTVSQNLTLNCTTIPDTLNFLSVDATSMLMLHCKIDWPLNLVISSETIAKYGQIFGYLLKLRHVSFVLEGTYEYLQQTGKLLGQELRTCAHFRHLQMMRNKLSHFMTSYQTHLVAKALQATWKSFKEQLCSADSIEELYKHHAAYLKRVAFLALLNRRSAKIKETIDNILVIILRFCKVIQSQSFIMDQDNQFVHPRFKRLLQEEVEFEKFMNYLIYLGNKAAASGYQEEIDDLICIISFNNYYKASEET